MSERRPSRQLWLLTRNPHSAGAIRRPGQAPTSSEARLPAADDQFLRGGTHPFLMAVRQHH